MIRLNRKRIIKLGGSLIISLPKVWLNQHRLNEDTLVELKMSNEEDGCKLILEPIKNVSNKTDETT